MKVNCTNSTAALGALSLLLTLKSYSSKYFWECISMEEKTPAINNFFYFR